MSGSVTKLTASPGDNCPASRTAAGSSPRGRVILWALAVGGFALAMILSYRAAHQPSSADLRTPAVVLIDALLAIAAALVYAAREGALSSGLGGLWSLAYGLWATAVFRLVPPILNESVLYYRNMASADVPYVLLGAAVHGGIVVLLANPYARRLVLAGGGAVQEADEAWHLGVVSVVIFFIVAVIVRVAAELRL